MAVLVSAAAVAQQAEQPVRLVVHDPAWAAVFERERAALAAAIGAWAPGGIHHVGSTAIPGVDAVPVVDILVGTAGPPAEECLGSLLELGYAPGADDQPCCKPAGPERLFELYLIPVEAARYSQMLAFRDLLRGNLQMAIGYAGLKRDLAHRHAADRRRYTAAKGALVRAALARAPAAASAKRRKLS
jgi:GrpB-like predicted nucleotidyltransferase (UPF0157 family)